MTLGGGGQDISSRLAEQFAFYRAVAPEYERHAIKGAWGAEPEAALEAFAPGGAMLDLLEPALAPGVLVIADLSADDPEQVPYCERMHDRTAAMYRLTCRSMPASSSLSGNKVGEWRLIAARGFTAHNCSLAHQPPVNARPLGSGTAFGAVAPGTGASAHLSALVDAACAAPGARRRWVPDQRSGPSWASDARPPADRRPNGSVDLEKLIG